LQPDSQIRSRYRHISSTISSVPSPNYANMYGSCQAERPAVRGGGRRLQLHVRTERHHTTAEGQEKSCHLCPKGWETRTKRWAGRAQQLTWPKPTPLSLMTPTCSASSSSHAIHGYSLPANHPPFLVCVSLRCELPVVSHSVQEWEIHPGWVQNPDELWGWGGKALRKKYLHR